MLEPIIQDQTAQTLLADSEAPINPPKGRTTDEFLQLVASAYVHATASGRRPGPTLAELAGVPVRTVHGWISQARKRGILLPADPAERADQPRQRKEGSGEQGPH